MASPVASVSRQKTVLILILMVGAIILYRWRSSTLPTTGSKGEGAVVENVDRGDVAALFVQKECDVTKLPQEPKTSEEELSAVSVQKIPIIVSIQAQTLTIYSLQTMPKTTATLTVLLLHGLGDDSHNWEEVKTLQLLALWGYRAVAVDLPGHGNSKEASLGGTATREDFMVALVKALGTSPPVIVAPSMGGSFAIPYLFRSPSVGPERAAGFIAVAPINSEMFTKSYPESQMRTLILYGVKDVHLGVFSRQKLQMLPRSHIITLPDAGHACFKEQPALFHRALYHYLRYLVSNK